MAKDPEQLAHQEWLGYVQPVGLVVSAPALLAAQAYVNRNIVPDHQRFLSCLRRDKNDEVIPEIRDFARFSQTALGWEANDLIRMPTDGSLPNELSSLEIVLPEYHETLRPTHFVWDFASKDRKRPMILVRELPFNTDFDEPTTSDHGWQAPPHAKFERLLRETTVPVGLLVNQTHLRLVYAPRGETSGYITFSVAEMAQVAGRPIFAGLHLLLSAERLFSLPEKQRLPAVLAESRKYQNTVSTQLAEQVLGALYELLRGFQAADDQRHGGLLRDVLNDDPNQVYAGLLNVLMRLVFILYSEDRGVLPGDSIYANHYSVTGLFERLREDAGHHPDTMDLRFGAWAQLLTLFRMVHAGGTHGAMKIPAREGYLFDPDRYPFLEGRSGDRKQPEKVDVSRVSDGVVSRVLSNLLILDGERLSYRTLDVEQIGSVYEAIMGFNLEVAQGRSIAIKPTKSHGAPTTINLDELLASKPKDRPKWLRDQTDQSLTGDALEKLQAAESISDLLNALDRKISKTITPNVVPKGAMVLQPSDERRRTGSHYTPRFLTEPIVRTTLRPILERLGERPTPEQILDLKVCDPAMGSGAFLVEACRQLGDELMKAWHMHNRVPAIPPDEDEVLHARRRVAQRCLYGVDKNPMAVDLAKLSLWLATLAKDHPFTFLDHSLRCGDSLVGLSREQIVRLHWQPGAQRALDEEQIRRRVERATEYRRKILDNAEGTSYLLLRQHLALADQALQFVRLVGDVALSAFFAETSDRGREERRKELFARWSAWVSSGFVSALEEPLLDAVKVLRAGKKPIEPFHWQIEFPEVFDRRDGGFDVIVGNPPFLGGHKVWPTFGPAYRDFLHVLHPQSGGKAVDIVAHFFRRAFTLCREVGAVGLFGTNTVAQGDTREAGLGFICKHGGRIFCANRRIRWPGEAAVVVSSVHFSKREVIPTVLDTKPVLGINSFLFASPTEVSVQPLAANAGKSFRGCMVYGMGFTFDDSNSEASSIDVMTRLITDNPANKTRIFKFIGGEDINSDPRGDSQRFIINFEAMPLNQASSWPDLLHIVEQKVRPLRAQLGGYGVADGRNERWWQYGTYTPALFRAVRPLTRCLALSQVSTHHALCLQPTDRVFSHAVIVVAMDQFAAFAVLQSRVHELWARFFGSSMKDDLRYTPSDCFEPFPFPQDFSTDEELENVGEDYYEFRAQLMLKNDQGLTKTYNRFHDPNESSPDIKRLRELHDAMDRVVLDSYRWTDLQPRCEFLLDYEEEAREEESSARHRRKPWRFRWPDDLRDEVLARLLELNRLRAEEERLAGIVADTESSEPGNLKRAPKTGRRKAKKDQPNLAGI